MVLLRLEWGLGYGCTLLYPLLPVYTIGVYFYRNIELLVSYS